jgi:Leucine rich repeat
MENKSASRCHHSQSNNLLTTLSFSLFTRFQINLLRIANMLSVFVIACVLLVDACRATAISPTSVYSPAACGPRFQGKCNCGYKEFEDTNRFVVNCTNEGFANTDVLQYLPQETEVVIFIGNYLPELGWNVFGAMNDCYNLSIVDMTNNRIREIRGKSFHHVPNVRRLILNHNNLSISRYDDDNVNHHHPRVFSNFINLMELHLTNAFADDSVQLLENLHDIFINSNLTKLNKLHLEQNEIRKFNDQRAFCDLPSLMDLHLGDNRLTEIGFNVRCLTNLRFLDLERNSIAQLKMKDLKLLDELQNTKSHKFNVTVDLSDNPFTCDCTAYNFAQWMKSSKVTVRNNQAYICVEHNSSRRDYLLSFAANSEKCRLQSQKARTSHAHTVTLTCLLVLLSLIMFGLLGTLLFISRDRIKTTITPMWAPVSKKVQYTTIKDDECPEQYV